MKVAKREPVIILSDRLQLETMSEKDISQDYIDWLNDPETMKFSDQRFRPHDKESCKGFLASFENTDSLFLAIKLREKRQMIGTIAANVISQHQTADIGILIGDRPSWGKGYGLEAWSSLMENLFERFNMRKVTGGTLSCNEAMVRIMQKSGMQPDGVRTDQQLVSGTAYDIVHYAKFNSSWSN